MDAGSRDEAMTAPLVQTAKQGGEARDWSWVEGSVWTDRMLSALGNGVKGGVWYSLMDKVLPCLPSPGFADPRSCGAIPRGNRRCGTMRALLLSGLTPPERSPLTPSCLPRIPLPTT